jgi:hypothetical protein
LVPDYPYPDPLQEADLVLEYTIHDMYGERLCVELRDILAAIGSKAARARWEASCVEVISSGEWGAAAVDEIHRASDEGKEVAGDRLIQLAAYFGQTIDGVFRGTLPGRGKPFVEIQSVDGSSWTVSTNDHEVVGALQARFKDVRETDAR